MNIFYNSNASLQQRVVPESQDIKKYFTKRIETNYVILFSGYTLNDLFAFTDGEWGKDQFRDLQPWAKKRMQELFRSVR